MFIFNGLWCFFSDFKEEKGNYQTQTHRGKRSEAFKVTSRGSWKTQTSHYASNHFFERKKSNRSFTRCHNNLVIFRFFFHHALMKKKLSDKLNKKLKIEKWFSLLFTFPIFGFGFFEDVSFLDFYDVWCLEPQTTSYSTICSHKVLKNNNYTVVKNHYIFPL